MKNLILIATLLFSTICFSQDKQKLFSAGLIGVNYNSIDTRNSPDVGRGFAITMWNVYLDINSNWVSGRGNQLDFQSSQSYDTNKTNIVSLNGGYSFKLNDRFVFTPTIGITSVSDIWEDPIGETTNFSIERKSIVGFGCNIQFEPIHPLNLSIGYGSNEGFRFGFIIDFNKK
jgi:hypothetical protein